MTKDVSSIILTPQEIKIMKIVWENGNATAKLVFENIYKERQISYTTIMTMMRILEKKGVLVHSIQGRAYLYRPLISRRQAIRNQIHDLLGKYFDDEPDKMIDFLFDDMSDLFYNDKKSGSCGDTEDFPSSSRDEVMAKAI
ncbi:MAG: BlaI/MecI/CopY family transcriptional regulator [Acidobacteriota bacterium]